MKKVIIGFAIVAAFAVSGVVSLEANEGFPTIEDLKLELEHVEEIYRDDDIDRSFEMKIHKCRILRHIDELKRAAKRRSTGDIASVLNEFIGCGLLSVPDPASQSLGVPPRMLRGVDDFNPPISQ